MLYLFQTIVYAAICCLFYLLFLKDRPMHRFNRKYLLVCAALPFLLPFAELRFLAAQESPVNQYMNMRMPEIVVTDVTVNDSMNSVLLLLGMGYMMVSAIILTVNVYKWQCLKGMIRKAEKQEMPGYTLLTHTGYGPGSWARYIFLPEGQTDPRIIAHETAHVRLKHTRDITVLTALQCLLWYNPFLYFIKKELRQVHEFEADAAVQGDTAEYQELLLHHFLKQCRLPFTHSFINHPIKRRIMMLNKNNRVKSYTWSIVLTTTAFLFFAGNIIWFQSCQSKKWEVKEENQTLEFPQQGKESKLSYKAGKMEGEIYTVVDKMPQPTVDLPEFLGRNIRYPEEAKKNKIEGKVIVRFIINKEGNVTEAKVVKSPNELLSQEALRVINLMPTWTSGENKSGEKVNVYFTQPINFRLENEKSQGRNDKAKTLNRPNLSLSIQEATRSDIPAFEKMLSHMKNGKAKLTKDELKELTTAMQQFIDGVKKEEDENTIRKFNSDMQIKEQAFQRIINPFRTPDEGC